MADPARIKTENSLEKEDFTNEDDPKTEQTENVPESSADDTKEPSTQDHPKDLNAVS